MKNITHFIALFALMLAATFAPLNAAKADEPTMGLFVNLTTDDTWAAAKAISFANNQLVNAKRSPVAIWLNVRGVYLAEADRPSNVPGLLREKDQSIQDLLTSFIASGGQVIMCQTCSAAAGLTIDDYIDGVVMGNPILINSILFDPNVKTLSW